MNQLEPECQVNPPPAPHDSYLRGPVGVHMDHVLSSLFDLELNVILSLQGSQAAAAAHPRLAVRGIWGQRAIWVNREKTLLPFENNHLCMCYWSLSQINRL